MRDIEQEKREALEAAQKKAKADQLLVSAYRRVYGVEGKRDQYQQLVWNSMMKTLQMPNNFVVLPDGSLALIQDAKEAELNEGARTYIWNLKRMIESSSKLETE